jgi:hypothetical protein
MKITRPYKYLPAFEGAFLAFIALIILRQIESPTAASDILTIIKIPFKDANNITATATVTTVILLYLTWKQAKFAADDSERPHITIMIRLHPDTNRVLVISNTGKSVALNSRLRLRDIKDGLELKTPDGSKTLLENPLFHSECDLPEQWLYEFLLQKGIEYAADTDEQKYPRNFSIDVRFESLNRTIYEYKVPIDISAHKNSLVPKRSVTGQLEIMSKQWLPVVDGINSELQKIRNILTPPQTNYEDGTDIQDKE